MALFSAALWTVLVPVAGLHLTPTNLTSFVIAPDVGATLQFNLSTTSASTAPVSFTVRDYAGNVQGLPTEAAVDPATGIASLVVKLSTGWHEVRCVETNQSFGVIAQPPTSTWPSPLSLDNRFGVVAGMTQICNTVPAELRHPMLAMMVALGIKHFRDFPQLDLIRPDNATTYVWDSEDSNGLSGKMDSLHNDARALGAEILDCF
eukprot:gene28770-24186_t